MFKQILLISLVATLAFANTMSFEGLTTMWESWKSQHGKTYATAQEETTRMSVFAENVAKIEKYNAESDNVKLAVNRFADLTASEFKNIHSQCGAYEANAKLTEEDIMKFDTTIEAPASVDWRQKGAVTPVKDQGQCGSCWSFSATGVIESFHFIQNGTLVSLSEQQLIDCNVFTDHGCNGGLPQNAITYAAKYGLETEAEYPYKASEGLCHYNKAEATANMFVKGFKAVTPNNLDQFKAAVVLMPVSVGIEADQNVFQFYSKGVITKGCGASLDHAVLVVGYTTVDGVEAFIVKNSWAATWGVEGYVMIATDPKANNGAGVCGILSAPVIPTN